MSKTHCDICDRNFKNEEALEMHNRAKHASPEKKESKPLPMKKIRNWGIFIIIIVLLVWGVIALIPGGLTLPPTTMQGHTEQLPSSHVLKKPMPIEIQKHMLEHADGVDSAPPGIILSYNCDDFDCEPGMIENLEAFATEYPANVYVAPFKNLEVKIALTRLNKIQVLDEYNEQVIDNFIKGF